VRKRQHLAADLQDSGAAVGLKVTFGVDLVGEHGKAGLPVAVQVEVDLGDLGAALDRLGLEGELLEGSKEPTNSCEYSLRGFLKVNLAIFTFW
jgi:hypothetical protein